MKIPAVTTLTDTRLHSSRSRDLWVVASNYKCNPLKSLWQCVVEIRIFTFNTASYLGAWNSVVGVETRLRAGDPGLEFQQRQLIVAYPKPYLRPPNLLFGGCEGCHPWWRYSGVSITTSLIHLAHGLGISGATPQLYLCTFMMYTRTTLCI